MLIRDNLIRMCNHYCTVNEVQGIHIGPDYRNEKAYAAYVLDVKELKYFKNSVKSFYFSFFFFFFTYELCAKPFKMSLCIIIYEAL